MSTNLLSAKLDGSCLSGGYISYALCIDLNTSRVKWIRRTESTCTYISIGPYDHLSSVYLTSLSSFIYSYQVGFFFFFVSGSNSKPHTIKHVLHN